MNLDVNQWSQRCGLGGEVQGVAEIGERLKGIAPNKRGFDVIEVTCGHSQNRHYVCSVNSLDRPFQNAFCPGINPVKDSFASCLRHQLDQVRRHQIDAREAAPPDPGASCEQHFAKGAHAVAVEDEMSSTIAMDFVP